MRSGMVTRVPDSDSHRHPCSYTDEELRQMLRAERTAVTRQVIALKHQIRDKAAQLG